MHATPLARLVTKLIAVPVAGAVVVATGGAAHAATRTVDDSYNDVRLSEGSSGDVDYDTYYRTDIHHATVGATRSETRVTWGLGETEDDLDVASYRRVAKLRVVARVSPKSKKTKATRYQVAYVAGEAEPLTLERIDAGGPTPVTCTDLYYEASDYDFEVSIASRCLGKLLKTVTVTFETHAVDKATSIELFDTVQVRPVAY